MSDRRDYDDYSYDDYGSQGNTDYGYGADWGNGENNWGGGANWGNGSPQSWGSRTPYGREPRNGFGIASFILGLISAIFFCSCCNILTAALSIVFGVIQLLRHGKKGFAIAGITLSIISLALLLVCWVLVMSNAEFLDMIQDISGGAYISPM